MKTTVLFLSVCVVCGLCTDTAGGYPDFDYGTRAQLGSKVVGVTVVPACPFDEIVEAIRTEGKDRYQADYTEIVPVIGQENCPANIYGPVGPVYRVEPFLLGLSIKVGHAVTLGLHYRVVR